jgi:hypothetical protein
MGDTRRFSGSYRRPGRVILRVADGPDQGKQVRLELADSRRIRGGRSEVNERTVAEDMAEAERTGVTPKNRRVTFFAAESEELMAEAFEAFAISNTSEREVRPGVVRPALRAALRGLQGP